MLEVLSANTTSAALAYVLGFICTARAVYCRVRDYTRDTPQRDVWLNWLTFVTSWALFTLGGVLANG